MSDLCIKYGVQSVSGQEIFDQEMDIYAPCALGATLNTESINALKAKVVAGAANNQLADEKVHGDLLAQRDIVYAPDFVVNAGGIINVYAELANYDRPTIMKKTEAIFDTTLNVFDRAIQEGITTHEAALLIAQERINLSKK